MPGIGVVVRDYNGNVIGALSQKIALPQSIEHAKALAASWAVAFAKELGLFESTEFELSQIAATDWVEEVRVKFKLTMKK
ncbi:hypothetical protein CFP56_000560 [Quercus suber]|uniref:RNase H type-1 domain-containing protein n=1 Tax=Quercus suber TaxID=58331 RepID=A0AAW0IPW0_QUESU